MLRKGKPIRLAQGKLIVFEGIDGSGKTTQVNLLFKYLKSQKVPFSHYSFPRYDKPWGKLVRRYLNGEFGGVGEVSPYLASVFYAGDRLDASASLYKDLDAGKIVVCDRYVASNIAYQAAKVESPNVAKASMGKQSGKSKFIKWIEDLEYRQNKIPKEDLTVLLSVPPKVSQNLMSAKIKDIHEKDKKYLGHVYQIYDTLAKGKKNWERFDCVKSGKLLSPAKIHERVLAILGSRKFI